MMKQGSETSDSMIKFKSTNTGHEIIELAYAGKKSISEYKDELAEKYCCKASSIKLVFKGKILENYHFADGSKIQNGTVMVVINEKKKEPKKTLTSAEQVISGTGMSTGLSEASPVGFGGYGIVNHPQYMSAISSAVDPEKMEEMLNDPTAEGMIEQMMEDPDTLRSLVNGDPMMKSMMKDNPMLKMMMDNPEFLKMAFNKETLKKTREMMKNNGGKIPDMAEMSQQMKNSQFNQTGNLMGQQYNPINGSNMYQNSFGMNPMMNPMMNQMNPMMNPNLHQNANNNLNNPNSSNNFANNPMANNPFGNMINPFMMINNNGVQPISDEVKYKAELKELESMGFTDKQKNIQFLKETNGDVDKTLEKLCPE